jgi:hypothetical protein
MEPLHITVAMHQFQVLNRTSHLQQLRSIPQKASYHLAAWLNPHQDLDTHLHRTNGVHCLRPELRPYSHHRDTRRLLQTLLRLLQVTIRHQIRLIITTSSRLRDITSLNSPANHRTKSRINPKILTMSQLALTASTTLQFRH